MPPGIEIERKYLIKMPDEEFLATIEGATVTDITRTLSLCRLSRLLRKRVRKAEKNGKAVYTYTLKFGHSRSMRHEQEEALDEKKYLSMLKQADKNLTPIKKRRWKIPMKNGLFAEIDIYPFWKKQAICEVETETEDEYYTLPDFIEVIREVTEDE